MVKEKKNGEKQIYRYVYEYDENGFIKSEEWDSIDGLNSYGRIEYTTDEYGRIIKSVEKGYNEFSGKQDDVWEYTYNEDGEIIKKEYHSYATGGHSVREYEGFGAWYHKYYYFYDIRFIIL